MHPFYRLFSFTLPSYGSLILLGLALALAFVAVRARRRGLRPKRLALLAAYALGFGAVGAKLLYLLTAGGQPLLPLSAERLGAFFGSGYVYYGGLAGGLAGLWLCGRLHGVPLALYVDPLVPALPLCHAFGRVGCFLAGCCYGIPMDPPLGVAFSQSLAAPNGVPLFPVQLLEALLNAGLFFLLRAYTQRPRRPFSAVRLYLLLYTPLRFFLEFLRYDAARGLFLGLSTSQWLSAALLLCCALRLRLPGKGGWARHRADQGR